LFVQPIALFRLGSQVDAGLYQADDFRGLSVRKTDAPQADCRPLDDDEVIIGAAVVPVDGSFGVLAGGLDGGRSK